ncbi:MAG: hypothetical protein AB1515_01010 [Nitrospirota bacterium]
MRGIVARLRRLWRGLAEAPVLVYAPEGWRTVLTDRQREGWNAAAVVAAEERRWGAFVRNCRGSGPLGFSHEHDDLDVVRNVPFHNVHLSYAYVLALAAHGKSMVSVLDWGGGLGHYSLIGKAALPDVALEFHCLETPAMAAAGQRLNPSVQWHTDDACLERMYDLVMINGSLQYMEHWRDALRRAARAAGRYLFLTRLPVVQSAPSFVAVQRIEGTELLHQQLNQRELLEEMEKTGLRLVREFVVGDRPYIGGAPEQCEMRGWLWTR